MGVEVAELAGSPTFSFSRREGEAQRSFMLDWDDRIALIAELLPPSRLQGTSIVIPPAHVFPGLPWLILESIAIGPMFPDDPLGMNENPAAYTHAKADLTYTTTGFDQDGGNLGDTPGGNNPLGGQGEQGQQTFVKFKVSISGEFLTWPNQSVVWETTGDPSDPDAEGSRRDVPEDVKVVIAVPSIEHNLDFNFVPFPAWFALRLGMGCVNAYEFMGAPPETLLFLGLEGSRELTNTGFRTWTLGYKFLEKNNNPYDTSDPHGWNHFLRTEGHNVGAFERLNRKAPGGRSELDSNKIEAGIVRVKNPRAGFWTNNPLNGVKMAIKIRDEILTVNTANPTEETEWEVNRAQFGTAQEPVHEAGDVIQQIIVSQLSAAVSATTNLITVDNPGVFPELGQFFVQIENEFLLVVRRFPGTNTFGVLRGVRGQVPAAHAAAKPVILRYSPIYPLWDYRTLFQSGLVLAP